MSDPSEQMRGYLSEVGVEASMSFVHSSEALVRNAGVGVTVASAAKRFALNQVCGETAEQLRQMESSVAALDAEVTGLVDSVTLLEDVARQLRDINKEMEALYQTDVSDMDGQ